MKFSLWIVTAVVGGSIAVSSYFGVYTDELVLIGALYAIISGAYLLGSNP